MILLVNNSVAIARCQAKEKTEARAIPPPGGPEPWASDGSWVGRGRRERKQQRKQQRKQLFFPGPPLHQCAQGLHKPFGAPPHSDESFFCAAAQYFFQFYPVAGGSRVSRDGRVGRTRPM